MGGHNAAHADISYTAQMAGARSDGRHGDQTRTDLGRLWTPEKNPFFHPPSLQSSMNDSH